MRKILKKLTKLIFPFFILTAVVIGIHCTQPVGPSALALVGTWDWLESMGGIAGSKITPKSVGYTKRIRFTLMSIYEEYVDGKRTFRGMYRLKKKIMWDERSVDILEVPGKDDQFIRFTSRDTLILADNFADGWQKTFVRLD